MEKAKFKRQVMSRGICVRDNKWVVIRIRLKGEPIFVHVGHVDTPGVFKDAEAKLAKLKLDAREGKLGLEPKELRLRINQAADIFLEKYAKALTGFKHHLDLIKEFLGYNYMDATTKLDVQYLRNEIAKKYHVCDATVNKTHMVLTNLFNRFYEWKEDLREYKNLALPVNNPGERCKMPSTDYRDRTRIVLPAEFDTIQDNASENEGRIILGLMHSLLRQCDLRGLRKSMNIDRDRNCFIGLQKKTGRKFEPPITDEMWAIINSTPGDLIFEWFPVNFDKNMREICERAKIPPIQPRDFRRSAARRLIKIGYDIDIVRQLLGHGDIRTTQRYVGAQPIELQAAGKALSVDYKWRPPTGPVALCGNCKKHAVDRYTGHGLCVFCFSLTKRKYRPVSFPGKVALKVALRPDEMEKEMSKNASTNEHEKAITNERLV